MTENPAAARAFYGALFGWTFEAGEGIDPGYTIIKHDGRPIGGHRPYRSRPGTEIVAQWLAYVVVADVDSSATAFRRRRVVDIFSRTIEREESTCASRSWPMHKALRSGLVNRGPHVDDERPPAINRWLWMDTSARDADGGVAVLRARLSASITKSPRYARASRYYLLTTDCPRAGLFRSPWERETSAWLPYVRVADSAAMAMRAVELGGRVVVLAFTAACVTARWRSCSIPPAPR